MFRPPVLAVRAGQRVRFTNSDGSNHNVNAEDAANRFDAYTTALQPHVQAFRAGGSAPTVVRCHTHPWMVAWVYVFEHPWFAVTDASGRFVIDGVPAGPQRLLVRHAGGGLERRLSVTARERPVEVVLTAADRVEGAGLR
jgi:hypothetical protein